MKLLDKRKLKTGMIVLCMVMAARLLFVQAKAEGSENRFSVIADFTDIGLWYVDENGEPSQKIKDGALLGEDARLALRYDYRIAENEIKTIAADTPYYLEVSPHLALPDLPGGSPLTVKIEGGEPAEFGKICANGSKAWILFEGGRDGTGTFLEAFLTENGIGDLEGTYFYLDCNRAKDLPTDASPVEGKDNLYVMKFENNKELQFGYAELERTEAKAEIVKNGGLQDGTITWKIDYTPWQNPDPDGTDRITEDTAFELRDTIDSTMHSYVAGSIKIDGTLVTEYQFRKDVPEDKEIYAVIEDVESGTVLNIGGKKLRAGNAPAGNPAQPMEITYDTLLNDELLLPGNAGKPEVANSAKLFAERDGTFHELGISGSYKMTVEPPVWIKKDGKTTRDPDGNGSFTDWTITFNPNGFTFAQGNALTLHDQLPEGSTLAKDSISIDGVKAEEKDILMEEGNQFSVSVDKEVNQSVTITYRTTVPEEMYENGTNLGENTAWFTFLYQKEPYETPKATKPVGSGDGSGKPGTDVLVKSNGGYQKGSRSVEWTVDINPHMAYLKGGIFRDDLGETTMGSCNISGHKKGLELAGSGTDDITVLLNDQLIADSEKGLVSLDYADQVLTVTVGEIGARKVTLRYTTKVCDPCIFANNTAGKQFVNRVSTTNMVIGKNSSLERSASGESKVDVSAAVLTKKAPFYDYDRGVMQWTVEVNAAGLPMRDIELTDALPAGLTYLDGTFRTDPILPDAELTASDSGRDLTMKLGDIGERTILVMFETKVNPEKAGFNSDGDVGIANTVVMRGAADGVSFAEVSHSVEQRFVNHGLMKGSKTDNINEWIDYEVLINPFGLSLPQSFSLVDTLDRRLQLDEDTLRAYRATVSGTSSNAGQKPNYVKKEDEPPLKIDGYEYDPETNSFTVKLHLPEKSTETPEPEKSAYVLAYRADIVERQAGGYGNSVRFEGGTVKLGGTKRNSAAVSGGGGGGGGVLSRRVNITVTHTDSSTGQPLSGVTYTLYEWDKANNRRIRAVAQGVTDAQGKVSFKVKPDAVYELVQTKGVSDYDDVPGWDQLPEGVLQGGAGLLITVEAAGSKRELELTGRAEEPTDPNNPGDTDDTGNTGDGDRPGNTVSDGNPGDDDRPGSTVSDGNPGSTGNEETSGNENDLIRSESVNDSADNIPPPVEDPFAANPENIDYSAIVDSPQTGDDSLWPKPFILVSGVALLITAVFLWNKKKA